MLYNSFRVSVLIVGLLGFLHMITVGSYIYIFFPLVIIIWAVYSFFDENDREYLRRNGIDPDEISWFFPDYEDYGAIRGVSSTPNRYNNTRTFPTRNNNCEYRGNLSADAQYARYAPQTTYFYSNPQYNTIRGKCKRNFKITLSKEKEETTENG